jgi:putative FmdB family regulatory protein
MPTYTYRCQSCGVQFEKVQKFDDKPLTRCPECRKGAVKRVFQPAAIVFKGSGWYATDHRSASGQSASRAKGDEATKSDGEATKPEKANKPEKKEKKAAKAEDRSS